MDQHITNLQKTNKISYLGSIHLAKKCLVKNEEMLRNSRFFPINVYVNYYMLVGHSGPKFYNVITVIVVNF
jgi:hypothetical protein